MNTPIENFIIHTDKSKLDIDVVHEFLTNSYWAAGRSKEAVQKAIEHSLCFGVYTGDNQVGFARVITDYVAFAYLADVFVLDSYRGLGLGRKLVETILAHLELQQVKRWMLGTRDASGLYSKCGFKSLSHPEIFMEILNQKQAT